MTVKIGDRLPDATLYESTEFGEACPIPPAKVQTAAASKGKRVVLFGLPGAYTPTCSAKHVPGYVESLPALRAKGVDEVWCVSVNDGFVMAAWGRDEKALGKVRMLGDGSGELAKKLGLDIDIPGMGLRMKRFSALIEDGVIAQLNVEEGGKLEVSDAATLLKQLGLSRGRAPARAFLVELGVATKDAVFAVRHPALRGEVGREARPRGDAIVEGEEAGSLLRPPLHRPRKRVAQAGDDLEEREIDVAGRSPDGVRAPVSFERALEVRQKLGEPLAQKRPRAEDRFRTLLLVEETARDRVMGVVDLAHEIGDRELERVRGDAARLALRDETVARREVLENVRRLRDHELAGDEEGRGERLEAVVHLREQGGNAAALARSPACDVDVWRAGVLEEEPDELAAPLDRGPVVKLVRCAWHAAKRRGTAPRCQLAPRDRAPRASARSALRCAAGVLPVHFRNARPKLAGSE